MAGLIAVHHYPDALDPSRFKGTALSEDAEKMRSERQVQPPSTCGFRHRTLRQLRKRWHFIRAPALSRKIDRIPV